MLDNCQGAGVMESFLRGTCMAYFVALCEGYDAKGCACRLAFAHHVEIAHFKYAQGQQSAGEQYRAQREKRQG